jgi:hypothetical protein
MVADRLRRELAPHAKIKKKPAGVYRASGSMRALMFRLLKPPRARLTAVMMMMITPGVMVPAQIHSPKTLTKRRTAVKSMPAANRRDPN